MWTPSADSAVGRCSVWLHGGAYVSGGGALDWYSGARLAREGDLVVVGVNYRLGALGWLHHRDLCAGNLGLLDQHAALEWVRDNIAAFGGDPGNVTLWGQSAGAQSIALLLMCPQPHRAACSSASSCRAHRSAPHRARPTTPPRAADRLLGELGIETSQKALERLKQVPVARLLTAQGAVAARIVAETGTSGRPLLPFGPVADGTILPASADYDAALREAAARVDVLDRHDARGDGDFLCRQSGDAGPRARAAAA